jgi:hypothetical protein
MFTLSLVDHLRLTFGHVIHAHRAHAQLAARHAAWNRWSQALEAVLVLGTAAAAAALLATAVPAYAVVAAATGAAAAVVLILRLVLDFDRRVSTHRACSARLWYLREQYRALLADLRDGHLTIDGARERRDLLMSRLQAVYEDAPPADTAMYAAARRSVTGADEGALSDEEIDRFLPVSLQKDAASPDEPRPAAGHSF